MALYLFASLKHNRSVMWCVKASAQPFSCFWLCPDIHRASRQLPAQPAGVHGTSAGGCSAAGRNSHYHPHISASSAGTQVMLYTRRWCCYSFAVSLTFFFLFIHICRFLIIKKKCRCLALNVHIILQLNTQLKCMQKEFTT